MSRSWKPVKNGKLYCSPACGGNCTWQAFTDAQKHADALVAAIGADGWRPIVWENSGWFYRAEKGECRIGRASTDRYYATIGHFWETGSTPETALYYLRESISVYVQKLATDVGVADTTHIDLFTKIGDNIYIRAES